MDATTNPEGATRSRHPACPLKTRPSRLSCGFGPDPLLAGHSQMAWDPCRDSVFRGSHAPGVGAGEPRTLTTARGLGDTPAEATAEGYGPDPLSGAVEARRTGGGLCIWDKHPKWRRF